VAVDTPRGLVVPVIRNADRLGVVDIARELTLLAARAPPRPSSASTSFAAVRSPSAISAPSAGLTARPSSTIPRRPILLLGRSRWLLGIHEGKIEGRLKMPLSLSFDHRIVDGAAAARFLNDVIDYLQAPGNFCW